MRFAPAVFTVLALLVAPSLAAAGSSRDDPDSLAMVLDFDLVREKLEEHSGMGVFEFRLYTGTDASKIAWWRDEKLYLYTVVGDQHDERALALLGRLQQNGLASFVVARHPDRRARFTDIYEVHALQIVGPLHALRPSGVQSGDAGRTR